MGAKIDKNLAQALKLAGAAVVSGVAITVFLINKAIPDTATREDYPGCFHEEDSNVDCS